MLIKRILMNAADQGGGGTGQPAGGNAPPAAAPAPAPAAPAPAQPQAQGALAFSPDVIKTLAEQVAAAVTPAVRDSIFADARRAGLVKPKGQPADGSGQATAPATPTAPDLQRLRSLDRTVTRFGLALSDQQYQRLERDFVAESPDNVEGWLKDYFPGSSGSPTTPQAPASPASAPAAPPAAAPSNPTTPQPANALPVSDRGSPPVPRAPLEEQSLITMTPSDREALRARIGNKAFSDLLNKQLRDSNVRFSLK